MWKKCSICDGDFEVQAHKHVYRARNCRAKLATPGQDCWFELGGLHMLIAESLAGRAPTNVDKAQKREVLFRGLQAAAVAGETTAKEYLRKVSPPERWLLQDQASPSLRDWLVTVFKQEDLLVFPELTPPDYTGVPETLLPTLQEWEKKNYERLISRMEKGHNRARRTLHRLMAEPVALARFLGEQGVLRWDAMTMSDRIAFAKTRSKRSEARLGPFISFLDGKNPFKDRRGRRPPQKTRKAIKEVRRIPIIPVDELKERIKGARQRLPDDQYLLYWMVAKLGLTAKAAYGLTADRITINKDGRLVIRPAEAWVALPRRLAYIMEALVRKVDPEWPHENPDMAPPVPVMKSVIAENRLGRVIYQSETTLLRSSAIHAAMHAGQLDRKTLMAITGVSHTTIARMEYLVPADIHSLASHDFVRRRNAAIQGDTDE